MRLLRQPDVFLAETILCLRERAQRRSDLILTQKIMPSVM